MYLPWIVLIPLIGCAGYVLLVIANRLASAHDQHEATVARFYRPELSFQITYHAPDQEYVAVIVDGYPLLSGLGMTPARALDELLLALDAAVAIERAEQWHAGGDHV